MAYPDGVAYIVPEAFRYGPGVLASTLLHERIHFEQNTTPGKGDKWSDDELEAEAFKAEVDNSKFLCDPIKDAWFIEDAKGKWQTHEESVRQANEALKTIKGRLKHMVTPRKRPDFLETRVHSQEELAAIERQGVELDQVVARELEAVRQKKKELEDKRQESEEEASRHSELIEKLKYIAQTSCDAPGTVNQFQLDLLPHVAPTACMTGMPAVHNCPIDLFRYMCNRLLDGKVLYADYLAQEQSKQEKERLKRHDGILRMIVNHSCDEPGSVRSDLTDGLDGFSDPHSLLWIGPVPVSPDSGCFVSLYNLALEKLRGGYVLDPNWFRYWADQFKPRPVARIVPVRPILGFALADLAVKACADPASLSSSDIDRLNEADFPSRDPIGAKDAAKGLTGCAKDLFDQFLGFCDSWKQGDRIKLSWLREEASRLIEKNKPQPVFDPPSQEKTRKKEPEPGTGGPCGDGGSGCGRPHPTMPRH